MKRYEILLNLALLAVIGGLIYLIYQARDLPRTLDELEVPVATAAADDSTTGTKSAARAAKKRKGSTTTGTEESAGAGDDAGADQPPGTETSYKSKDGKKPEPGKKAKTTSGSKEVADAGAAGDAGPFGERNIFRALLTPTPTPPPPTPTPAPTPNITTALGSWRLLSIYEGKAMFEDVKASEAGAEGAIWEMPQGATKQVDVGNGIMKTAVLKKIDNENPYNPEVVFTLEDTTAERKINLDTEPVAAPAGQKK